MTRHPTFIMRRQPNPRFDLYCLPHAGGNAFSYADWQAALGEDIQVIALQMPGRAERLMEAPFETMQQIALATAEAIARNTSRPFAIFGHSMGGLVAFEATLLLQRIRTSPTNVFVSACAAPGSKRKRERFHEMDDDALIDKLAEYGGTPAFVAQNRELMELALPGIRADFRIVDEYTPSSGARISTSITVMAGVDDHMIEEAELRAWSDATHSEAKVRLFEGGHFYFHQQAQFQDVIDHVRHELADRSKVD